MNGNGKEETSWTTVHEKKFLDKLGTWTPVRALHTPKRRMRLLRNYINRGGTNNPSVDQYVCLHHAKSLLKALEGKSRAS
ncbi:MAG: hypothetical protein HQK86_00060 [Nitrospinae bacterium]|nr:hypothetical protein [Nitrospinota bacterium]MBF0633375.1 hypothetical protein [Nitrospinota bacterium]